jgi:hypothetical protein
MTSTAFMLYAIALSLIRVRFTLPENVRLLLYIIFHVFFNIISLQLYNNQRNAQFFMYLFY